AGALITEDARVDLAVLAEALAALQSWTEENTEAAVRSVAQDRGKKLGQLAQPLRAAVTGRAASPGIFEVLQILGQSESISRILDQTEPIGGP
ncbi:MAG: glutamate--tRNA ligase, partial [Alphaproteobacteria bacterium]